MKRSTLAITTLVIIILVAIGSFFVYHQVREPDIEARVMSLQYSDNNDITLLEFYLGGQIKIKGNETGDFEIDHIYEFWVRGEYAYKWEKIGEHTW